MALQEFLEPKEENWKQEKKWQHNVHGGVWDVTIVGMEDGGKEGGLQCCHLMDYSKQFAIYSVIGLVCHHLM
jgi:hypothetical protein